MDLASAAPKPVRYAGAGTQERGFLLRALVDAWDNRCHWCGEVGDQSEFEIDHILPPDRRDEGIKVYGLKADFDVQSVMNLAPICAAGRRCNQSKSNTLFAQLGRGILVDILKKAAKRADQVERRVRALRTSKGLGRSLDHVLGVELDSKARQLIRDQGLAMVLRLRAVDPDLVDEAPSTYRHQPGSRVDVGQIPGCAPEDIIDVVVELDGRGRTARAIVEKVCDVRLGEVIDEALEALNRDVDALVREEGPASDIDVVFDVLDLRFTGLTGLRAERTEDAVALTFRGNHSSTHTAQMWALDNDGKLVESGSCDISVFGDFTGCTSLPLEIGQWDRDVTLDLSGLSFDRSDDFESPFVWVDAYHSPLE